MAIEQTSIIKLAHTEIFLRADGIIQVNATNHLYSVSEIKEIHKAFYEITGGKKALILLIADQYTSIESEARHFLSTQEAGIHSIAEAYVIKSLAQRLLLNFLFSVQKTPVPAKFFTELELAVKWLKKINEVQKTK